MTNLTDDDEWNVRPSWSTDGSKILFESTRDGTRDIFIMDDDGGNAANLTQSFSWDTHPVWTSIPATTSIDFASWAGIKRISH